MRRAFAATLLLASCRGAGAPSPDAPPAHLIVAYPFGLDSADPTRASDGYSSSILSNVYEPLVDFDPDLRVLPALAESWETPDDVTWLFKLRTGARLHDGRLLDAEIAARSLRRARDDPGSKIRAELAAVASIEAEGAYLVRIRTRYPFAALPNRLASVPVADPLQGGAAFAGTGPYRLTDWAPGRSVHLEAFEAHRAPKPGIRALEFRVIPDHAQRLLAMERGDVHLVSALDAAEGRALGARPDVSLASRQGLLVLFLAMDCSRDATPYAAAGGRNPFKDLRVRQAVASALDRDAILRGPLSGQGEVVEQIVGPQVFGFDPALPRRSADAARARSLLASAGWKDGFDTLLDLSGAESRSDIAVAQAVSRDLGTVGIRVRLRVQSTRELLTRVESSDTSFYLMPWISTSGDFGITADYLLHTRQGEYGIDNGGGYSNPEVDRLLEAASRTLAPAERRSLLESVAARVHEDVPVMPLFRATDLYALRSGLVFHPRLDRQVRGRELRWSAPSSR